MRMLLFAAAAIALYLMLIAGVALSSRPVPSDLAVVFGNAIDAAGAPSPRLRARLDTAVALVRAHLASRVLVSGGVGRTGGNEATAMAAYLVSRGVPPSVILQDGEGDDTLATARHTAALLGPDGTVIVVTQWFHVPRAMLAMRRCGVRGVSAAWPRFVEGRDVYSFVREAVALPVYALRRVAVRAPAAAGPPAP